MLHVFFVQQKMVETKQKGVANHIWTSLGNNKTIKLSKTQESMNIAEFVFFLTKTQMKVIGQQLIKLSKPQKDKHRSTYFLSKQQMQSPLGNKYK